MLSKLRLQYILFAAFTLISSVPVILLAIWVQQSAIDQEWKTVQEKHLLIAHNLANEVSRHLQEVKNAFGLVAENIEQQKEINGLSVLLESFHLRYIIVLDNKNKILQAIKPQNANGNKSYIPETMSEEFSAKLKLILAESMTQPNKVLLTNLIQDGNGDAVMFLVKPISRQRYVVASLSPLLIRETQKTITFGQRGHAVIVDKTGKTVAHPNAKWVAEMKDISGISVVQKMMLGETGIMEFFSPSLKADMVSGYTTLPEIGWGVMISQPKEELNEQVNAVKQVALAMTFIGIAITGFISWFLAAKLSAPIKSVAESAIELGQGKLISQITNKFTFIPYELKQLINSFNRMIVDIRDKSKHLELSSMRLAEAQRIAHIGNWELDIDNDVLWCSDEFYHICDVDSEKFGSTYQDLIELIHLDDRKIFEDAVQQAQRQGGRFKIEHRINLKNQAECFVHHEGEMLIDKKTKNRQMIGVIHDITERRLYENKLSYQANFDELTDLPNRTLLLDRLNQESLNAKRQNEKVALLSIDLDNFKFINDTHGHVIGDKLLQKAAERMSALIRESDTLARTGGDEFSIILNNIHKQEDCTIVANNIINSVANVFIIDNIEVFIGASIGITIFPDDSDSPTSIMRNADTALFRAKTAGKGNFCFFKEQMNKENKRRMILSNELRRSVENGEISVNFQPIIDIHSGLITNAEALVRWNHPELGFISPVEFIPIAEDTGLIGHIGEFVLQVACENAALWMDLVKVPPHVSVNLSVKQIRLGFSRQSLEKVLQTTGLPSEHLCFEITESMVIADIKESIQWMNSIRECGASFAIDDFGTGYSSLSYLKRLPVDTLKIDRSFISDIGPENEDTTLVDAIIAIGKSLNLKVVAEGTETKNQIEYLSSQHCDYAQGYYYSKPIPADEFAILLKSWEPKIFLDQPDSKLTG